MREELTIKSETSESQGHTRLQWAMVVLVNITTFSYGLQVGWVSPMIQILQSAESPAGKPLSDIDISLIAGLPSLGAVVGILILLYVVDTFGRRYATLVMTIFQSVCWIIKLCPSTPTSLFVARFFCGLGAGGCFTVVPMYIKELSQDNIRGTLGSVGVLFQNFGILTIYILGSYLSYNMVLYIVVGIPFVNMAMLLKAPESPSFLVKTGKFEEAAATVAYLRGLNVNDKQVLNEIDSLKSEDDYFRSIPNISFINIYKEKAWRRGFIILVMVFTAHGLNGSFSMVNYASSVLANLGVSISPQLQSLGIPVALTIGSLITMSCVDKLGRKVILGAAFLISVLTFFWLASALLLRGYGYATPGWLSVAALLIVVCCYGGGVGPVPFIIVSEMFNFQVRAKFMACLSILAWIMSFIQLISFTAITGSIGAHASFYIFGAINLFGALIMFTIVPETAGKRVDEIENNLRNCKEHTKKQKNEC